MEDVVQRVAEYAQALINVEFDRLQAERIGHVGQQFAPRRAPAVEVTGNDQRPAMGADDVHGLLQLVGEFVGADAEVDAVQVDQQQMVAAPGQRVGSVQRDLGDAQPGFGAAPRTAGPGRAA